MSKINISAVINICNEDKYLAKCLSSVQNFADEIVVIDMESVDRGVEIAKSYGAKIFTHRKIPWVEPARNFGISKAKGKWILILDPDEYITKHLKKELKKISKRDDITYVKIPRKNLIFGKWMRHSVAWPDYLIRFFVKNKVTWKNQIHSQPDIEGNGHMILDCDKLAIRHNNYPSIDQYLIRAIRYSRVQAEELQKAGALLKISDIFLKPVQEFNSRFYAAQGYKDGIHGLVFCMLQAFSIFLVYIRLWEMRGQKEKTLSKDSFVSASQEAEYEYGFWFQKFFLTEYSKNIIKKFMVRFRQLLNRLTKNF